LKKQVVLITFLFIIQIYAKPMQEGEFVKQKQELIILKQELDEFYNAKEQEYKQNKSDIVKVEQQIQNKLDEIKKTKQQNEQILKEINLSIKTKTMTLYSKMKLKILLNILNEKISAGQINEVFDIIIRLKDKRVINLLKKFDTKISTELMDKLDKYKMETPNG
jgi:hypothetical protein